jgi:hypothetical protein
VQVFYFPQTAAQDFYRTLQRALLLASANLTKEAQRADPEYDADSDPEWAGMSEAFDLFQAIKALKASGALAVGEFSWLKTAFPKRLPPDAQRAFEEVMVGLAAVRQVRLSTAHMPGVLRTAVVRTGSTLFREGVPRVLTELADACKDAAQAYFAKNRIEFDADRLVATVQDMLDQYKAVEQAFAEDLCDPGLDLKQRALLQRYMNAHQAVHHGVNGIVRSLCVFKTFHVVPTA